MPTKVLSIRHPEVQIRSVTIDDIEFDQPRFQKLLATHGELLLMDQGVTVARILPPVNDQAMNSILSPLENPHVS